MDRPPTSKFHLPPVPQTWRLPGWPQVSVSVLTYNQARLVGRALESILAQITDFDWEIVVGDDGSTDGTQAVLKEYYNAHPDRIRLFLHPDNAPGIAGRYNNMHNLTACRGRYTALLDGDDYWASPHKLQQQFDVMERHPELSISLHDTLCREVDEGGRLKNESHLRSHSRGASRKTGFYPHEAFCTDRNLRLQASSFFFRSRVFGGWPPDFTEVVSADHYLFLLISQRGPAHYSSEVLSVYERQVRSFSNGPHYLSEENVVRRIAETDIYRRHFPATRITPAYATYAVRLAKTLLIAALKRKDYRAALRYLRRIAREPRGATEVLTHRLRKLL